MHFTTPRIVSVDATTTALCVGAARGATCGCDIRCRICPDSDVAREMLPVLLVGGGGGRDAFLLLNTSIRFA